MGRKSGRNGPTCKSEPPPSHWHRISLALQPAAKMQRDKMQSPSRGRAWQPGKGDKAAQSRHNWCWNDVGQRFHIGFRTRRSGSEVFARLLRRGERNKLSLFLLGGRRERMIRMLPAALWGLGNAVQNIGLFQQPREQLCHHAITVRVSIVHSGNQSCFHRTLGGPP